MIWIFTSLATYFLWAITNVIDKSLLTKKFPSPLSYALLGGIILFIESVLLIPFWGIFIPPLFTFLILFLGGISFIYALVIYTKALSLGDASTIVPLTSFAAVFTLLFSWLLFGNTLTFSQFLAFALLVAGGFFISRDNGNKKNARNFLKAIVLVFLANLIFGFSYTLQGYVLNTEPFWNSFIWMRIFGFCGTLSLLAVPSIRRTTKTILKTSTMMTKSIFVGNQFIAFVAFLLLSYSFSIASTPLVNALQGTQYAFLFFFILLLSFYFPRVFREELTGKIVFQKVLALFLIGSAIAILALK